MGVLMSSKKRVVITGLGTISPLGNSTKATWEAACAGESGVATITRFDVSDFPSKIAAEIKNFNAEDYIEAKEVKKLDLFSQYALAAAQEAWDNSGLSGATFSPERMGCIMGVGIGGISTLQKYHEAFLNGGVRKISPFLIPGMISNLGPGNIAIRFGLKGVNFVITSACTSATHALGEAYRMIADGVQDVIFAGGSEAAITTVGIGGFCSMKALSTRNDEPQRASRPFDKDRDGFVMGEGGAMLVLESLESAEKRGANILAEIRGYGASCDAYHITAPSEEGEGAIACMTNALASAGMKPEEISYVNAHGTSTPFNDKIESLAIKRVYGPWAKEGLVVSSTKSMTGHLLGAAGAVEAVFSVLAIRDGIIPPTVNLETADEACDLDYAPLKARKTPVNAVMSNSFGFGGTNASIIVSALK